MACSCADLLPPGASIPRSQCFPAMGVTVTAAFCWRDGPAGFLPVGEGPLTVPVVRLRGFPALQRDHCRLKGAMPSPKAYLVVLLFPGMSYHPRHTCMAIRWHKNAIGTSPGLEPGSRRQFSAKPRRPPWAEGPPSRGTWVTSRSTQPRSPPGHLGPRAPRGEKIPTVRIAVCGSPLRIKRGCAL